MSGVRPWFERRATEAAIARKLKAKGFSITAVREWLASEGIKIATRTLYEYLAGDEDPERRERRRSAHTICERERRALRRSDIAARARVETAARRSADRARHANACALWRSNPDFNPET